MIVKRIEDRRPAPAAPVTVKLCGNVIEVRYAAHGPPEIAIEKLSADKYLDLRTGEVKEFQHTTSRAEDKASVAQSLRKLRDLINCNVTDPATVLWVTLTYKENMRDTQRLYEDFHAFIKRFRRYLKTHGHPPADYIVACEPQHRGAWHLHCLYLFPGKAPFIPNADMARIWGHGFTKTKSLKVDNPGLYLTAYLGDMELTEAVKSGAPRGRLAEVETVDEQGRKQKKAVVKGARLHLYPPGFNLYRASRGVKRPEVMQMAEWEAQEIIGTAQLTYEKTVRISDGQGQTVNVINYRQYNKAKPPIRDGSGTSPIEQQGGTAEMLSTAALDA